MSYYKTTRKPSWRKGYARQRRHSKRAVSRHLGFYRTGNNAIPSADPENHCLELNMEWIWCTVCETAFKQYCDLETGVRGHSRSSKVSSVDRPTPKTWPYKQTSRRSANWVWSYGHFCISKMAVSRHLGFYRSAEPENPNLQPNMEWIGCRWYVCEIFAFKLYHDLENGVRVTQGHLK